MRNVFFIGIFTLCGVCQGQELIRLDGAQVRYVGISKPYAEALAKMVSSARRIAIDEFQFEMPDVIFVEVIADPDGKVRLFNDGQDNRLVFSGTFGMLPRQPPPILKVDAANDETCASISIRFHSIGARKYPESKILYELCADEVRPCG